MNKVSVALALLALLGFAAMCAENRDLSGNQKATLKLLEEQSAAHRFTLDTIKASNAEREIADQKHADSLRQAIARFRGMVGAYRAPGDTLVLTYTQIRYVTDTLIPRCEVCAARLDSAVLAARAEREAATLAVNALSVEKDYLAKEYAAIRRKRAWQSKLWPVALIAGVWAGAYIRGQP